MLRNSITIVLAVFCYGALSSSPAKSVSVADVERKDIVYAQQLTFSSKILAEQTQMLLYLPDSFNNSSPEQTYPVIFINGMHGEQFFHSLTGVVKHLSQMERMPESIVVSLNFSGHYPEVQTNDMWPRATIEQYGDPERYLQHLEEELFPYLKQHYRANEHRTIIGISGSALFPLYSMTHKIELFDAYLFFAAADMIGMQFKDQSIILDGMVQALTRAKHGNRFLYMGLADHDIALASDQPYRNNLASLQERLKPLASDRLKFQVDIIGNERHYDAFIKAMLSAFDLMYPESLWGPKYRQLIAQPGDALGNVDAFYQQLSKTYGVRFLPRAERWNSPNSLQALAARLRREGRLEESIRIAKRWREYRPKSPMAYYELAQSYQASQQPEKALRAMQKAVALGQSSNHYRLTEFKAFLDKLKHL